MAKNTLIEANNPNFKFNDIVRGIKKQLKGQQYLSFENWISGMIEVMKNEFDDKDLFSDII